MYGDFNVWVFMGIVAVIGWASIEFVLWVFSKIPISIVFGG